MCGICGFIGLSKKPKATFEIITNLFDYTEIRGTDASGIWATEIGEEGKVLYHKEPIRSGQFIHKEFWAKVGKFKINLLLAHARATSKGNGHARFNNNNHPFVSLDKRIGMVHNGSIDESGDLAKKYQCLSDTDSEIILRIFEKGIDSSDPEYLKADIKEVPEWIANRLTGIKDIYGSIQRGAMAVAIGEREKSQRNLFLFRNEKRPLWMADLREGLGQVFFFSSPEIWYRAICECSAATKAILKDQKIIEIPSEEVWVFFVDEFHPQVGEQGQCYRFELTTKQTGKHLDDNLVPIRSPKENINIVTELNELEEVSSKKTLRHIQGEHELICHQIKNLTEDICISLTNEFQECTINSKDYSTVIEQLEDIRDGIRDIISINNL